MQDLSRLSQLSARVIAVAIAVQCTVAFGQFSFVVNSPPTPLSLFGTRLVLDSNSLVNFTDGETVTIIQAGLEDGSSTNIEVNISGGSIHSEVIANEGSTVNLSGGSAASLEANAGGTVNQTGGIAWHLGATDAGLANLYGGSVGGLNTEPGSTVNIYGGNVDLRSSSYAGGAVNLYGGTVGPGLITSQLTIYGGQFELNGELADGPVTLRYNNDTLTGVLEDGTAIILSARVRDYVEVNLVPRPLPEADLTPLTIENAQETAPRSLRPGQTLTIGGDAELDSNFAAVGATLNIAGGKVAAGLEVASSTVNISDGFVGGNFAAFNGSVVNLSGGTLAPGFLASAGVDVNISGGYIGSCLDNFCGPSLIAGSGSRVMITGGLVGFNSIAEPGSEVNISGGGATFSALREGSVTSISAGQLYVNSISEGATLNISGGTVRFEAAPGSNVNLLGTEFLVGGEPIADIQPGESRLLILDDPTSLSGRLADGTWFDFSQPTPRVTIAGGANLTIRLVPEPSAVSALALVCALASARRCRIG